MFWAPERRLYAEPLPLLMDRALAFPVSTVSLTADATTRHEAPAGACVWCARVRNRTSVAPRSRGIPSPHKACLLVAWTTSERPKPSPCMFQARASEAAWRALAWGTVPARATQGGANRSVPPSLTTNALSLREGNPTVKGKVADGKCPARVRRGSELHEPSVTVEDGPARAADDMQKRLAVVTNSGGAISQRVIGVELPTRDAAQVPRARELHQRARRVRVVEPQDEPTRTVRRRAGFVDGLWPNGLASVSAAALVAAVERARPLDAA